MRMRVGSLGSLSGSAICIAINCDIGRRCSSDPVLLWLWCRQGAVAPIRPLAWELPYAAGAALAREVGWGRERHSGEVDHGLLDNSALCLLLMFSQDINHVSLHVVALLH